MGRELHVRDAGGHAAALRVLEPPEQFKRTPRIYVADAISCGRTVADQGQSVIDVASELDYLGTSVLLASSVELAADAEQAAVDVLRAHPPADS